MANATKYPYGSSEGNRPFASEVNLKAGPYGLHDTFRKGFVSAQKVATPSHPLEYEQKTYLLKRQSKEFDMIRNTQGLHMPMKLQLERALVSKDSLADVPLQTNEHGLVRRLASLISSDMPLFMTKIEQCNKSTVIDLVAPGQRPSRLPSSNLSLRTLMDIDDEIGFEDFLNDPTQPMVMDEYKDLWDIQDGVL